MDAKKIEEFTKTVVETYRQMRSGERRDLRVRLKREDRFIRHQQRFFGLGGQDGILYDVSGRSGGVLEPLLVQGSDNGEGTNGNPERIVTGTQDDVPRIDEPKQGGVCEGDQQEGAQCPVSEREETKASDQPGL